VIQKQYFLYDSADVIPAKLYFKIVANIELITLLSSEELSEVELVDIWSKIHEDDIESSNDEKTSKIVNISKQIENLASKYESIKLAVFFLEKLMVEDKELINLLKKHHYKFTGDLKKDLEVIKRESQAIELIIKRLQKKLPQQNEENSSKSTLDENILSYGIITGLGFIDTNAITLSQYRALVSTGNQKIKALENGSQG